MTHSQDYVIESRSLRVVFQRCEDRWRHRVELISSDGEPVPLFESVEGTPECSSQPSPPVQELQMHAEHDSATLLGVGMAGRNHWSLTCGVRRAQASHDDEDSICIEVACRMKDQTCSPSSRYRLAPHVELAAHDDGTMQVTFADRSFHIRPHGATASTCEGGFVIRPCDTNRAAPRTVQWSYAITQTSPTEAQES